MDFRSSVAGFSTQVLLAACAAESRAPVASDDRVELRLAPLDLPGIDFACYDVRVENAALAPVWSRGTPGVDWPDDGETLCSDAFGNGWRGDIAYVGPCDADGPDTDGDGRGEQMNAVTVWVDGLYAGGVDVGDWQDPCPGGCRLEFPCEENTDVPVELDLTILRAAHQGFFDVAVNFDDIFCSAKLDTCYPDGSDAGDAPDPIALLFGAQGARDHTAVFGFACTAGPGADVDTLLLYSLITVTCGATTFTLDPTLLPGNNVATSSSGARLGFGIYRGAEDLACGAGPCRKRYWNLAVDLADLAAFGGSCTLSLEATANDDNDGFALGRPDRPGQTYPYVVVDELPLTVGGVAACQSNPLNGTDALNGGRPSRVMTGYRGNVGGLATPLSMCSQFDGTSAGPTDAVAAECATSAITLSQLTSFTDPAQYGVDAALHLVGGDVLVQRGSFYELAGGALIPFSYDPGTYGGDIFQSAPPYILQAGASAVAVNVDGELLDFDLTNHTVAIVATSTFAGFKAEAGGYALVTHDRGLGQGYEIHRYDRSGGLVALAGDFTPDVTTQVNCSQWDSDPAGCAENGCFYADTDSNCGANDPVDGLVCSNWDGRPVMCRSAGCRFNDFTGTCATGLGTTLTNTLDGHTWGLGGSFRHGGYTWFCVTRRHGNETFETDLVRTDGSGLEVVTPNTSFCGDRYLVDGDLVYTINVRDWEGGPDFVKLDLGGATPVETVLSDFQYGYAGFPYGQTIQRASDGRLFAIGASPGNARYTLYVYDGVALAPIDPTIVAWGVNLKVIGQRVYFLAPYYGCVDCSTWNDRDAMEDGLPVAARVRWFDLATPAAINVIDTRVVPDVTNVYAPNRYGLPNHQGSDALLEVDGHVFFASYTVSDGLVAVVSDGSVSGTKVLKTNVGSGGSPWSNAGTIERDGEVWFSNYDPSGVAQLYRASIADATPSPCDAGDHHDGALVCVADTTTCTVEDTWGNPVSGTQTYEPTLDLWGTCADVACAQGTDASARVFTATPPIASGASGAVTTTVTSDEYTVDPVRGRIARSYQGTASCTDGALTVDAASLVLVAEVIQQCASKYYLADPTNTSCVPVPVGSCHAQWEEPGAHEAVADWMGDAYRSQHCN